MTITDASPRSWGARLGAVAAVPLLTLTCLIAAGAPGSAAPPVDLTAPLTDSANVLSDEQESEIEAALEELSSSRGIDLHVVFVDTFDGMDGPVWATATFQQSGLSSNEAVLAVAVVERRYGYHEETSVGSGWASDIASKKVEPELREKQWSGAALAAVEGYQSDDQAFPWGLFALIWAVVLTAVTAPWLLIWRHPLRRRRSTEQDVLDQRQALAKDVVQLEEELGTATTEAAYAEADLGPQEARHLQDAIDDARTALGLSSSALELVPAQPARRPAAAAVLTKHMGQLQQQAESLTRASARLATATDQVQTARTLLAKPEMMQELADRVDALQLAHADASALVRAQAGSRPPWLQARLADLLSTGTEQIRKAQQSLGQAGSLLTHGKPAQASRLWTAAADTFHQGEKTLAQVADPEALRAEALAALDPPRQRLSRLVRTSQEELGNFSDYVESADKVDREEEWASHRPDALASAISGAQALLRRPPDTQVDPADQTRQLQSAVDQLDDAVRPYLAIAQALRARREASSSGSSNSRSSSSRSSSRSRSSSGGGRF